MYDMPTSKDSPSEVGWYVTTLGNTQIKERESIYMDFIVGLPHMLKGHDLSWVIVDRLKKLAYFLPVKTS